MRTIRLFALAAIVSLAACSTSATGPTIPNARIPDPPFGEGVVPVRDSLARNFTVMPHSGDDLASATGWVSRAKRTKIR